MPLLLRGLSLPDNEIRAGVIDTLIATTDPDSKDNELVTNYASSLVTIMLKNAKAKDMPSPVRIVDACRQKKRPNPPALGRSSCCFTIHRHLADRGSV